MIPTWEELRERLLAGKPALRSTAYAIGKDPVRVRFDGAGSFTHADTGVRIDGEAWLTSAVEPSRFAVLATVEGTVVGAESLGSRDTTIAEVPGLRGGAASYRIWVDDATGCILRIERAGDPAPLVVLDGLVTDA